MKKFNHIIAGTGILYFCLSLLLLLFLYRQTESASGIYKIEINRIMENIRSGEDVQKVDISQASDIVQVRFLPDTGLGDTAQTKEFFQKVNGAELHIEPLSKGQKVLGYVCFVYRIEQSGSESIPIAASFLAIVGALLFALLFYLRNQVMKPFVRLGEMPYELSRGHLKGELPESKNRFFGKFTWGIAMLRDTLNDAKVKELRLEREKKLLLLSISHDIKTPLGTIQLYAKALSENVYDSEEKRVQAAQSILVHTQEIEDFVEEIIKSSSEDILVIEVKQSEFYIQDLVEMVRGTYEQKCRLMQTYFVIGACDNKLLRGDIDRAFEVVENLMENAIKYGDGQSVKITFYEEEYCQLIRVKNTGVPVAEQEMLHLFDSFYRGSNAAAKQGNGLGLYICRQIMHKMGGEIFAEREPDGMSFILVFAE